MFLLILSFIALAIVALTMVFSAHDLKLKGFRWNLRRVSFLLCGAFAVGLMYHDFITLTSPGWLAVGFRCGFALFLVTNPFQIPWHKWIWKGGLGSVA